MTNRNPHPGRRSLLLGAFPFIAVCGHVRAGTISDAKGIAVSSASPKRIVSIGSSVTEIIVALGKAESIVAIDSTSRGVPGAEGRTDIGYMRNLSVEGVLSQAPDLICAASDSGPPEVIDALRSSAVPLALIPQAPSLAGVLDKIRLLGALLDSADEAAELSTKVSGAAHRLESKVAALATRPNVLFILGLADNRLLAGGGGTAANSVIEMAGGRNIAAAMQGYKPLAAEILLATPPDAVVTMAAGGPPLKPEEVFAHPGLKDSPASARNALYVFDGAYLLGFGPRAFAAAEELAHLLHPELKR